MCLTKNLHVMTEVPSAICVRFSQEHFLFVFLQWRRLHCPLNVVGVRTISTSPRDSVTRTAATKTSPSRAFKWSLITVTNLCRGEGKKKKKKTYLFVLGGWGKKTNNENQIWAAFFRKRTKTTSRSRASRADRITPTSPDPRDSLSRRVSRGGWY